VKKRKSEASGRPIIKPLTGQHSHNVGGEKEILGLGGVTLHPHKKNEYREKKKWGLVGPKTTDQERMNRRTK